MRTHAKQAAIDDFTLFVAARQRHLQRTAWLLTGDWTAAEDLVQTALANTWRHWNRVTDNPEAYVRRCLVNTFISSRRRKWTGERPTAALPEVAAHADDTDLRMTMSRVLADLPKRQRAVVVLRYFHDLPEAEVADLLGCAVGTVKSSHAKALARLRTEPRLSGLLEEVQP